jgi:spermidine synthase
MIIFIFLGIIASIYQIVTLRELTFSIAKNEFGFVIAVGFWLIACSIGSIFSTKRKIPNTILPALISLSFSFSIILMHLTKSFFGFAYYEAISLGVILVSCFLLIILPAFFIGYAFSYLAQELLEKYKKNEQIYARFFAFEAIGFFIGGLLFTFLLSDYSNPFIFSTLPLLLLAGIKNHSKKITSAIIIILISIVCFANFDLILSREFKGAKILQNLGSRYGPLILAEKSGVTSVYSNGTLLASSEDKLNSEEFIHMSLSALNSRNLKNVLILGPAISGQIEEILKYNLTSLDCVELNPLISNLSRARLSTTFYPKVNFINDDPRAFLKKSTKAYDAILMSTPAPSSLALNRYYTKEFFELISSRLNTNAIFAFSIQSQRDILSPQILRFNSCIINSLEKSFKARLLIPSESMIIIATNNPALKYSQLLENYAKSKIKTDFFTIYDFKYYLDKARISYVENILDKNAAINSDLRPLGFLNYSLIEQVKFYPDFKLDLNKSSHLINRALLLAILLILIFSFIFKKNITLINMGIIGFCSINLSSVILVLFQLYSGALFWKVGILLALFMLGLGLGTFSINAISNRLKSNNFVSGLFLGWLFSFALFWAILGRINASSQIELKLYLSSGLAGFLTGCTYPLLIKNLIKNKTREKSIVPLLYSSDLIGAFLGTLASGLILLPFLGVPYSIIILLFISAISCLRNISV